MSKSTFSSNIYRGFLIYDVLRTPGSGGRFFRPVALVILSAGSFTNATYWYLHRVSISFHITTISNNSCKKANRIEGQTANTDGPLGTPARPQIDPAAAQRGVSNISGRKPLPKPGDDMKMKVRKKR